MSKLYIDLVAEKRLGREQELNEDSVFCLAAGPSARMSPDILAVLGVANGMGGPNGGVVASSMATEYLSNLFINGGYETLAKQRGLPVIDHTALILEVFQTLNRKIRERFGASQGTQEVGTTFTFGLITFNEHDDKTYLHVGNVGTSRCYIIRGEQIFHATDDDSHAWQLYKKGEITYAEMLIHPMRHASTTIGMHEAVLPQVHSIELLQNDIVLFSTDGLHDNVDDTEIEGIVNNAAGTREAVKALVASAQAAGGADNIGVALAYCSAEPIKTRDGNKGTDTEGMRRGTKWAIGAGIFACMMLIAAAALYIAAPVTVEQASVSPPLPEPASAAFVQDTVLHAETADTTASSETAAPTQATLVNTAVTVPAPAPSRVVVPPPAAVKLKTEPPAVRVSVEWIAQTERFRIRMAESSVVPVRLSYGNASYEVVPVNAIRNLFKTTTPAAAESLPERGTVTVTLKGARTNAVTVGFTKIE